MRARALLVLVALASVSGCASSGAVGSERPTRPTGGQTNLLTAEEMAKTSAQDVFRAIELARPNWLRIRGTASAGGIPDQVQVYLGAAKYGDANSLRQVSVSSVAEVRYLDGREATTRYGTGHGAGAILIRLK